MDKDIITAIIGQNKAKSFFGIKPFDRSLQGRKGTKGHRVVVVVECPSRKGGARFRKKGKHEKTKGVGVY